VQTPRPVVMNAAFGDPGRDFAARRCDMLFSTFTSIADGARHVDDITRRAEAAGRSVDVYTVCHVVCRDTQEQAEAEYRRYAVDEADHEAVAEHMQGKRRFSASHDPEAYERHVQRFAGGAGTYPLVGTPDRIAAEIELIANEGYRGAALSFLNYTEEIPHFSRTVLPILHEAGLR
jgi:alkanesulfonate monooxygenase SsuD/methylene tetrahydromethanopterin reductase-like flavin-dependent oxidoreductase (luciferase family)